MVVPPEIVVGGVVASEIRMGPMNAPERPCADERAAVLRVEDKTVSQVRLAVVPRMGDGELRKRKCPRPAFPVCREILSQPGLPEQHSSLLLKRSVAAHGMSDARWQVSADIESGHCCS